MAKKQVQEIIVDIKRRPVILPIQCGDCAFHKFLATYPKPCIELGTPASAETCSRFVPNPRLLGTDIGRTLKALASVEKPHVLAAAMLSAKRVQRMGVSIGQTLFFKVMGKDYISNYASGVVIGVTREQIVLAGREDYTALMYPDDLLTRPRWEIKLSSLLKRSKINDPDGGLRKINQDGKQRLELYEPELIGKARKKPLKKRGRPASKKTTVININ